MEVHFYHPPENKKSIVGFYVMMANPASSDNHAEGQKMHVKGRGNAAGRFIIHQINHQLTMIHVLKIVGLSTILHEYPDY